MIQHIIVKRRIYLKEGNIKTVVFSFNLVFGDKNRKSD